MTDEDRLRRAEQMVSWAAELPHRCAVFAVNNWCAHSTAQALFKAGRPFPRTVTLVGADGAGPTLVPGDFSETVSSIRLDHELAGYLAAKALGAFAANDSAPVARMTTRALRGMTTAACAANDYPPCGRNNDISSLSPKAASSSRAQPAPSLPAERTPSLQRREYGVAVFPPLLVDRRQSTRGRGRRETNILKAMEMIRREACDGLTAVALAARFPGSRRLFEMRFREAMGHSPLDEILNVRLERAMELLLPHEPCGLGGCGRQRVRFRVGAVEALQEEDGTGSAPLPRGTAVGGTMITKCRTSTFRDISGRTEP